MMSKPQKLNLKMSKLKVAQRGLLRISLPIPKKNIVNVSLIIVTTTCILPDDIALMIEMLPGFSVKEFVLLIQEDKRGYNVSKAKSRHTQNLRGRK